MTVSERKRKVRRVLNSGAVQQLIVPRQEEEEEVEEERRYFGGWTFVRSFLVQLKRFDKAFINSYSGRAEEWSGVESR